MASKDQDLVKHGTNLPNFLQYEGKTGNTLEKMFNFGVLDWSRIEKWKANTKSIMKTNNQSLENKSGRLSSSVNDNLPQSDQQASNGSLLKSSLSRKFNVGVEKLSKSFIFKTTSTYKNLKSGLITYKISKDLHSFKLKENGNLVSSTVHENEQKSSSVKALLKLTMNNGIPSFKIVEDNSINVLTAAVNKLPDKDDTSLAYTFYSAHDISKKNEVWKKQDLADKDSAFGYNVVGNMKICSSYHAEFSGLERDLFVVRESVLYGPDCANTVELAVIIVKNTSKENYGGLGRSKSTVVILPGGSHSLPNSGQPSPLIDRWRSGGICDCGGWDIGCELTVLTNPNGMTEVSKPSTSKRLDLCYQGRHKEHAFRLATLENGLYSIEYNASSMSSLQAFSICVAVISSQNLTHIFQVNRLQDANDFIKPIMTKHRKVKSQTIVHPPLTSV